MSKRQNSFGLKPRSNLFIDHLIRFTRITAALIVSASLLIISPIFPAGSAQADVITKDGKPLLLAKKKKKKKRKKKGKGNVGALDTPVDEIPIGGTVVSKHPIHEGGKDGPYSAEVGAAFHYEMIESETTFEDQSSTSSATKLGLSVSYLMLTLMKNLAVGPEFAYESTDGENSSTSAMKIGGVGKYYFGDLENEKMAFFGMGLFRITSGSTTPDEGEEQSWSGNDFGFGGGMQYFLDSNVAATPHALYLIENQSYDAVEVSNSGLRLRAGLTVFW